MRRPAVPELLTPGEVAGLYRVNPKTVARWARAGKIESRLTHGGHRRYPSAQFARIIASRGWPPGGRS